ncbi:MAG TPA: hypothetical protein PLI51_03970 [bacterium]|nr:hypothetical protein [bacterium]HPQ65866.1 hypothetical protein [bacterium]
MTIVGRIEKVVAGGYGLIRDDGGVVFCRAVLPGETVEAEVTGKAKGIRWAEVREVLEPSPERTVPVCPFFPACGGCDFQHMEYGRERAIKEGIAGEVLRRIMRREVQIDPFSRAFGELPALEYRNTIHLRGADGALGYYRKKSRKIVDIGDCPIARPRIREALGRWSLRQAARTPDKLTLRAGNVAGESGAEPLLAVAEYGRERVVEGGALEMELAGNRFRVSPDSFFQMNTAAAELVVDDLRETLPEGGRLLDLFTGVGLFAVSLAERFPEVLGFEIHPSAVGDFRHNRRNLANVEEISWDGAQGLGGLIREGDVILADPPRGGLPERLIEELLRGHPRALAYISCNPATFARDCGVLLEAGYGFLGPIRLYDMFPRTAHIEIMGLLSPGADGQS